MENQKDPEDSQYELAVAVITPINVFPSEHDLRRVNSNEHLSKLLKEVAEKQELTNTSDWVAKIGDRTLNPEHTFGELHLKCLIEIEWHKGEGGGGA